VRFLAPAFGRYCRKSCCASFVTEVGALWQGSGNIFESWDVGTGATIYGYFLGGLGVLDHGRRSSGNLANFPPI